MEWARSQQPQGSFKDTSLDTSLPCSYLRRLTTAQSRTPQHDLLPGWNPALVTRSNSPITAQVPQVQLLPPATCPPAMLKYSRFLDCSCALSPPSLCTGCLLRQEHLPPPSPNTCILSVSEHCLQKPLLDPSSIPLSLSHQDKRCSSQNC